MTFEMIQQSLITSQVFTTFAGDGGVAAHAVPIESEP